LCSPRVSAILPAMTAGTYTVITAADCPDLRERADEVTIPAWPEFMLHDPASRRWNELYERFPLFQFVLVDPQDDAIVAVGNSLPLFWEGEPSDLPDTGWDWAIAQGLSDHAEGRRPNTECALQIVVSQDHRGKGISSEAVRTMKAIGQAQGLRQLIVPARPTLKSRCPLTPTDRYISWEDDAGLPFDPWLRVHARLGGRMAKVCPRSMRITGTIADWEQWTGMEFPESGAYVVPGALAPVDIDRAADLGVYVEPNVWVAHDLS